MRPMEDVLALQSYAQAEAEVGVCFSCQSRRETIAFAIAAEPAEPIGQ